MPAPLVADWSQVQAVAIALGSLRAAADRCKVSYDAVKQRAKREQWPIGDRAEVLRLEHTQAAIDSGSTAQSVVSPPVTVTAGQQIADHLRETGEKTRSALATALHRAAGAGAALPEREALAESQSLHNVAKAAALVHGWQQAGESGAGLLSLSGCAVQINVRTGE